MTSTRYLFAALALSGALASPASIAQTPTDTLAKIRSARAIVLGYREAAIPFAFTDAAGKPVGYAIDLCLRAVDVMKAKLAIPDLAIRWQPVTSANRVPLVTNGSVDLECGSTSNTLERQQRVAFGPSYFVSRIAIAVKADSDLTSLANIGDRPIAATIGTTSVVAIKRFAQARGMELKDFYLRDHRQTFEALASGRAAAIVLDHVLLASFIKSSADPKAFRLIDEDMGAEVYGAMLRRGDKAFHQAINQAFSEIMRSGEAETLYAKWFMSPIPPGGVVLDMPATPALKRLFAEPSDQPW